MLYNKTLIATIDDLKGLRTRLKQRVKEIMGWTADGPYYERITGRIKCTPAEQAAFTQAFKEIEFKSPADLFPEAEAKAVYTVE